MLKRFTLALRHKIKLALNYVSILVTTKNSNVNNFSESALFDLKDARLGPYYYALIFAFHQSGFQILIMNNWRFIANCTKVDREIFRLPSVRLVKQLPAHLLKSECLYIYDRFVKPIEGVWRKNVKISTDVYSPKPNGQAHVTMPFSISPHLYVSGEFHRLKELRKVPRSNRVFFSGNLDRIAYQHPIFKDFFKKMDRIALTDTLKDRLTTEEIVVIQGSDDLTTKKKGTKPTMMLYDWAWSPKQSRNLNIRINNGEWLATMASSDFFLCAPGIRMPLCFNCVEAIAVGTIPVLEYPEYFDPPLKHMKNAIVFSGPNDLIQKVKLVLSLDQNTIQRMSAEVADYYDNYLYPAAVVDNLNSTQEQDVHLFIHATQSSYDDYLSNYHRNESVLL